MTPATMWTRNHTARPATCGTAVFRNGIHEHQQRDSQSCPADSMPVPGMAEWGDRVETEQRLKGQRTDHLHRLSSRRPR